VTVKQRRCISDITVQQTRAMHSTSLQQHGRLPPYCSNGRQQGEMQAISYCAPALVWAPPPLDYGPPPGEFGGPFCYTGSQPAGAALAGQQQGFQQGLRPAGYSAHLFGTHGSRTLTQQQYWSGPCGRGGRKFFQHMLIFGRCPS